MDYKKEKEESAVITAITQMRKLRLRKNDLLMVVELVYSNPLYLLYFLLHFPATRARPQRRLKAHLQAPANAAALPGGGERGRRTEKGGSTEGKATLPRAPGHRPCQPVTPASHQRGQGSE